MAEKHAYGSFDYKIINKDIRDILDARSRLNNTVQVAMPFVKATTTVKLGNVGAYDTVAPDGIGFTLGLHGINEDVNYEDIYSEKNSNYPLIGYTYNIDGTPKRLYAINPFESIQTTVNNIFDKQGSIETYPDNSPVRVPPPGITNVTVGRNKNGLLASAQLQITVPSLIQLESLHKVFLVPGMGMILEWGQQFASYKNNEQYSQLPNITEYLFPWNDRTKLTPLLNRIAKREVGLNDILKDYVYPSKGQYMWMFGRVANFNVQSNSDGSFNVSVKIVGPSEDAWAYSTMTTVVPRKDPSADFFCATDTYSVTRYFSDTVMGGLNFKSLLDSIEGGSNKRLSAWKPHVYKISGGNEQKEGEPQPGTTTPTVDQKSFADSEDAYFITWRFFVNVVINDPEFGIKAIFARAGIDPDKLATIGLLLPYAHGDDRENLNVATIPVIDDPKESFVGCNKYLRSIDPSVMIIVNEMAAVEASQNKQYNMLVKKDELLQPIEEVAKFNQLPGMRFEESAKIPNTNYIKDQNNPDAGFLSTGVWLNHKAICEAMVGADTILRGIVRLLERMNAATMGYWQLVLDSMEGEENLPNPHSYVVVDANYRPNSDKAVSNFIDNVHVFNKYIRKKDNGELVGSELIECSIDLALPKRLFSQIATLGLVNKQDIQNAGVSTDEEQQSSIKISDPNDTLAKLFSITTLSTKDVNGQGPDLTILPIAEQGKRVCGGSNVQTVAGTGGQGYQAGKSDLQDIEKQNDEQLTSTYSGSIEKLNSEECKKCEPCLNQTQPLATTNVGPSFTYDSINGPVRVEVDYNYAGTPAVPYSMAMAKAGYKNGLIPNSVLTDVGNGNLVFKDVADAFKRLINDFNRQNPNVGLNINSGYRPLSAQVNTVKQVGLYSGPPTRISKRRTSDGKGDAATPGRSNHGWGLAIDFSTSTGAVIGENSIQFQWLTANARKYNIGRTNSESWHWEYIGPVQGALTPAPPPPPQPFPPSSTPSAPPPSPCDQLYTQLGNNNIEAGKAICDGCIRSKQVVDQVTKVTETRKTAEEVLRKFSGLRKAFRYVEVFPELMVASITGTANGNNSNAFGASPGSLSISGDMTLPGINGIRVGELFWIDRIPTFYKAFGAFQVMSVEDVIDISGWKTKINARFNYLGNRWKDAMANKLNQTTR